MSEEGEFITNDIDKVNSCATFMKLYLSLVDDLQKRDILSLDAADQANIFMSSWFSYACGEQACTEMAFIQDD